MLISKYGECYIQLDLFFIYPCLVFFIKEDILKIYNLNLFYRLNFLTILSSIHFLSPFITLDHEQEQKKNLYLSNTDI